MKKVCWFLTGGLLGAAAAIFLTPRTGEQTRNMVADYAGTVVTDAQGARAQAVDAIQNGIAQAQEKGAEVVSAAQEKRAEVAATVQDAAENVKDAAVNARGNASDKNDELREKIEAARARIAAQMKQNAAEDAAVAGGAAEVAETAETAEAAPYESAVFVDSEDFADDDEDDAPVSAEPDFANADWGEVFVPEQQDGKAGQQ
jgi:gas vesicle protein